jgi:hypothetical protein
MPHVVNNITRAEAIQLHVGIGDAFGLIRLNSLLISCRKRVSSK